MARASRNRKNYYENTGDKANRILNLALGMAEKIGVETPIEREFATAVPAEGFKQVSANTTNPSRPRAKAIGYHFGTNTLYVVFRDGTWWEYRNCPVSHFEALRTTDSTGQYLASSGLDQWSDMGPADMDNLAAESKERLSYAAALSARLQQTLILEDGDVELR